MILADKTQIAALLLALAIGAGCAAPGGPALVREVEHREFYRALTDADATLFEHDAASHFRIPNKRLPIPEQRQEFTVFWTGSGVASVRFAFRQVSTPIKTDSQTVRAEPGRPAKFVVAGTPFVDGGRVDAWHISLLDREDKVLAERSSNLW